MAEKVRKEYEALTLITDTKGWTALQIELDWGGFSIVLIPGRMKFGQQVPDYCVPPVLKENVRDYFFRSGSPDGRILRMADSVFVLWLPTSEFLYSVPNRIYGDEVWVATPGLVAKSVVKVKIVI